MLNVCALHARRAVPQIGRTMRVGGWVKTGREAGAGAFCFLEVNDGSTPESIQVCGEGERWRAPDGQRRKRQS
jgi:aspartyl/asparaginyl-tRNA synthetase